MKKVLLIISWILKINIALSACAVIYLSYGGLSNGYFTLVDKVLPPEHHGQPLWFLELSSLIPLLLTHLCKMAILWFSLQLVQQGLREKFPDFSTDMILRSLRLSIFLSIIPSLARLPSSYDAYATFEFVIAKSNSDPLQLLQLLYRQNFMSSVMDIFFIRLPVSTAIALGLIVLLFEHYLRENREMKNALSEVI